MQQDNILRCLLLAVIRVRESRYELFCQNLDISRKTTLNNAGDRFADTRNCTCELLCLPLPRSARMLLTNISGSFVCMVVTVICILNLPLLRDCTLKRYSPSGSCIVVVVVVERTKCLSKEENCTATHGFTFAKPRVLALDLYRRSVCRSLIFREYRPP